VHRYFRLSRSAIAAVARFAGVAMIVAGLVLSSVAPAFAVGGQTGNINGRVLDDAGRPVPGATVVLAAPQGNYRTKTDGSGYFNLLGVLADTYTISIDVAGFATLIQNGITVPGGDTVSLGGVRLTRQLKTIGAVTARSASSAFTPNQTVPQFTIGGQQLVAAQGKTANADLSSALLAVPGFQQDSTGNLILQGSQTTQIGYQVDGIDITEPLDEGSTVPNFINGVRSIQVVPGAGDPSQGNAGAGVVNLLMKRGTNPAFGTVDFEADARPFSHQFNLEYGAASKDGRLSDYFSFLGNRYDYSYGEFGSSGFSNNAVYGNSAAGGALYRATNDFVNNFVYKFGKNNNQSLQVLEQNHYDLEQGNYSGLKLYYPSNAPDLLAAVQPLTVNPTYAPKGLTIPQIQSILGFESTQTSTTQQINNPNVFNNNTNIFKVEYDNAFNDTTNLALRFFHTINYEYFYPDGPTAQGIGEVLGLTDEQGGSRTGGNFEFDKQLGRKDLLTISGSYDFDRPVFSFVGPLTGLEDIGPNAIDFLRPANPNLPVSATNPCPVTGGCYLQQFFYTKGGTPRVAPMDLSSQQLINRYGAGIRDQFQVNSRLRLDVGAHYDRLNQGYGQNLNYQDENTQPVPGSVGTYNIPNWPFIETPHYLEPRYGLSYLLTKSDSLSFSYGRSIINDGTGSSPDSHEAFAAFQGIPLNPNFIPTANPFTGVAQVGNGNCFPNVPYPKGATATTAPSYNGTVGTTLQLGRPCLDYADLLYGVNDAFFPEIVTTHPGVYDNLDFSLSHQFKNGSALKFAPYVRQGYGVTAVTAPLVFNPQTGVYQSGSLVNYSVGRNTTSGVDLQYTLPERRYGLNGFASISYVNEFTTTPPASDNPYAQDSTAIILPASFALGSIYRAGFISPLTTRIGATYKTRGGFRIAPVLNLNVGFPYGSGLITPAFVNNVPVNVPNTNLTDQYGAGGTSQYVDPANPGSVFDPNIAATRGTKESSSGGGQLSRPQLTGNLTLEYTAPGSRTTLGAQILNIFNNQQYGNPLVNNTYQPVLTGIGGPLTGLNQQAVAYPGYYPTATTGWNPYAPYFVPTVSSYGAVGTPTTFRLYVQYAL
jgi:hypothetical protein